MSVPILMGLGGIVMMLTVALWLGGYGCQLAINYISKPIQSLDQFVTRQVSWEFHEQSRRGLCVGGSLRASLFIREMTMNRVAEHLFEGVHVVGLSEIDSPSARAV